MRRRDEYLKVGSAVVTRGVHNQASRVLNATESALDEVRQALQAEQGAASAMTVDNVEAAATVLHEHADELRPQVMRLRELRDDLSDQIAAFDRG
jgi:hypothetical protein